MHYKVRLALLGAVLAFGPAVPAAAQYDPYTQCLIDHCFGNYPNDPTGYEACRVWCWRTYGGGGTLVKAPMPGKLNPALRHREQAAPRSVG
ncbi:MAG: hypothetical protein QOE79_1486 [Sphingomonadales bacterium]|jgi:hypothetical protein|nr:hypothetical protein [Sphingomonadales bacterium]